MKKSIALVAMCATALSPVLSSAALAFTVGTATIDDPVPAGINLADLEDACTDIAASKGMRWSGVPKSIDGASITSGPSAAGDRVIDEASVMGVGPQIPQTVQVSTEPYRVGGSANMFGLAEVVAARWTDSTYEFTQNYTWQTTYSFTCAMTEEVDTPALGLHRWLGPPQAAGQANCVGDNNPREDEDRGSQCEWYETVPAGVEDQPRPDEMDTLTVDEEGTLAGFESSGGSIPVDPDAVTAPPVQVVVCISPGPKGGSWKKQNGYTGSNCTTSYFLTAPVGPQNNLNTGGNNYNTTVPVS